MGMERYQNTYRQSLGRMELMARSSVSQADPLSMKIKITQSQFANIVLQDQLLSSRQMYRQLLHYSKPYSNGAKKMGGKLMNYLK